MVRRASSGGIDRMDDVAKPRAFETPGAGCDDRVFEILSLGLARLLCSCGDAVGIRPNDAHLGQDVVAHDAVAGLCVSDGDAGASAGEAA